MKYQPSFPALFGSLADARVHSVQFFTLYNQQHRHFSIAMMTPENVHTGRAADLRKQRQVTLAENFQRTPNRFKHHMPQAQKLPTTA